MSDQQRASDFDQTKRDIPSFIEPRPPLVVNPFMRPKPQKGTNLMELFEEDSESEEPEWLQVYLRLKPCNVRNNLYDVKSDRCLITSVDTAPMGHGRRTQHNVSKMYTFSHIFGPDCSQKQIFEQVVKDNLRKLPEGHNFTLLTYGASGSGKTFTLMGTVQAPGLVPRSLEYVFRVVEAAQQPLYKPVDGEVEKLEYYDQDYEVQFVRRLRQVSAPLREKYRRMSVQLRNDLTSSTLDLANRTRYYVWVSFVEIYNEAIYDLLSNSDRSKATSKLRIREDANGNVYVKGATQVFVRSGEEAYDVLAAGKHHLQVAATGVHAASSRSHCIFTITMLTHTEEGVKSSCVRLCDLAGCERARHTRNTGARMQESRAINSSLHVLERCLHMLRRKQKKVDATLVPYRESKLTRLLGAGLSGARGEAVSMVVTLNPAPEYAHETRHVLQLAAVAKDIQVNQTIAESTLESSSLPDTTVESSAELMRLRADNERLHFELVQAQHRNKELIAAMEEKQQETAKTMFEIVEEAKDMTRQYYESQLQSLQQEMEEMQEEYESKLKVATAHASIRRDSHTEMGTPTRSLHNKIADLTTTIAILEEKLTAEKLARARAEEEVQHLRACIEERDEKSEHDSGHDNDEVIVTDSEDEEDDPYNESLEPTFKKEDINRSRILQKSALNDSKLNAINDVSDTDSIKNVTIRDNFQDDTIKDSTYTTDESNTTEVTQKKDSTFVTDESHKVDSACDVAESSQAVCDVYYNIDKSVPKQTQKLSTASMRGTYVVRDDDEINQNKVTPENEKATKSITNLHKSITEMEQDMEKSIEETVSRMSDRITDVIMKKLFNNKPTCKHHRDTSLVQFEQLEIASKTVDKSSVIAETEVTDLLSNIKIRKDDRKYFEAENTESKKKSVSKATFENREINSKPQESKVAAIEGIANANSIHEKRNIFSDNHNFQVDLIPKVNKNKTYFDNIIVNIDDNKHLNDVKKLLSDDRSPSIVKEDVGNNFEPSTIKKLLGESFTRQPEVPSSVSKISVPKKHVSVDIFEGFDSPKVMTPKEARSSIDKVVVMEKSSCNLSNIKTDIVKESEIKSINLTNQPKIVTTKDVQESIKKLAVIEKNRYETSNNVDAEIILKEFEVKSIKAMAARKNHDNFAKPSNTIERDSKLEKSDSLFTKPKDNKNTETYLNFNKSESSTAKENNRSYTKLNKSEPKQKENVSIFENCIEKVSIGPKIDQVETTRESMEHLVLKYENDSEKRITDIKIKTEKLSLGSQKEELSLGQQKEGIPITDKDETSSLHNSNGTVDEFDKIFKDVSPRATEFEMLVSQSNLSNVSVSNIATDKDSASNIETDKDFEKPKYNLRHTKFNTSGERKDVTGTDKKVTDKNKKDNNANKENIENKRDKSMDKINKTSKDANFSNKDASEEVLLESLSRCESKSKPRRTLRLRRRGKEDTEEEKENGSKLKNIVNLQKEFSDVTLDVPAPQKPVVKDIESPEEEENATNPVLGIQSCPSKSVTRSRRKLFTPRAEPLEESMASGDSCERIRVPRPSYHRTRARRKL